jgi:hypothetical protein
MEGQYLFWKIFSAVPAAPLFCVLFLESKEKLFIYRELRDIIKTGEIYRNTDLLQSDSVNLYKI